MLGQWEQFVAEMRKENKANLIKQMRLLKQYAKSLSYTYVLNSSSPSGGSSLNKTF